MKLTNSLFLFTFFLLVVSCKKDQDPIVVDPIVVPTESANFNFGFETWTTTSLDGLSYEEPAGGYWTTLNYLARLACPVTVSKSSDSQNGNYAVALETKQWGSMVIPGLLVMGSFIPQEPFVIQGKPFVNKPSSIDGYYKYLPVDGDTCVLYARLSKYNLELQKQDTIAEASITVHNSVLSYTPFSLVFDYHNLTTTPDSLTVLFVSSIDGANFRGHPGSKLFIDNLSVNYSRK